LEDEDYKVGYRRPPKHTRFKPGVSGNPDGGRTKREASDLRAAFIAALAEKIEVTVRGKTRSMMKKEVIVEKLGAAAAKGDVRAFKTLLKLREISERAERPPVYIEITEDEARAFAAPIESDSQHPDGNDV